MFKRLAGNQLMRYFGVKYDEVVAIGGFMPKDYSYIQIGGFVALSGDECDLVEPLLAFKLKSSVHMVVNPSLQGLSYQPILEPDDNIHALANPDCNVEELEWVFRFYVEG